jgi:hypothetical protein
MANFGNMGRRGGGGGSLRAKTVNYSVLLTTGNIASIASFGLLAPVTYVKSSGNANIALSSAGVASATVALTAGQVQSIVGTATGADNVVVPFTANLTGAISAPAAPTVSVSSPGSGQLSISWTDGSNGGATITAHPLYRSTVSGFTPGPSNLIAADAGTSPYAMSGLTDGTPYYFRLGATNSAGTTLAAESTGTPSSAAFIQPYNEYYIDFGDSRTVQNNTSVNSGDGPSTFIGVYTDNKLRPSPTWTVGSVATTGGIGGQNAVNAVKWPRPVGNSGTASFNGTTMTVGTGVAGDKNGVGQYVVAAGVPDGTKIISGTASPFTLNNNVGVLGSRTLDLQWRDTKTIADVAADIAASVVILLGTNGSGAPTETAAVMQAIAGLTTPGSPYPGYRPLGEATDQPLPLYNGLAKTIILVDEMRRGIDEQGNPGSGVDGSALATHVFNLQKLHYASGDALANPHVYVARIFNDPQIADLTSATSGNPSYLPKPGYMVGGLHNTVVSSDLVGRVIGQGNTVGGVAQPGLSSLLTSLSSTAVLADTTNWSGNGFLNNNPVFDPSLRAGVGNTFVSSGGTVVGAIPTGTRLDCSIGAGLTLTITYNLLPGNLGYECEYRLTGTPSADGSLTQTGTNPTSGKRALIQATDKIQLSWRQRLHIASGRIYEARGSLSTTASALTLRGPGVGGNYGSGGPLMLLNNKAYSGNSAAVVDYASTPLTMQTSFASGVANPANGGTASWTLSWFAGEDLDVTWALSNWSVSRT